MLIALRTDLVLFQLGNVTFLLMKVVSRSVWDGRGKVVARPQAEPGSYRLGLIRLGYFIILLTDFDRYLIVFLLYIIDHKILVVVRKSLLLFCILTVLTSVASGAGTKLVVSNSDCGFSKNSVTVCCGSMFCEEVVSARSEPVKAHCLAVL